MRNVRGWWRRERLIGFFLLLALVACQQRLPLDSATPVQNGAAAPAPAVTLPHVPPITGRVDLGALFKTQALTGDIVDSAALSLIDTGVNATVASTVTDAQGGFTLALPGWSPVVNGSYILEAAKRVNFDQPGNATVRFRTIVLWTGSTWASISTPSITLDNLTTAISILSSLYPGDIPPASAMNKVNSTANPPGLNPNPVLLNHSDAQVVTLGSTITNFVSGNADPVRDLAQLAPTLSAIDVGVANPLQTIALTGNGFSPLAGGNTVTVNGMGATVLMATPTQIIATVPSGGTTGPVIVSTALGTSGSLPLTIAVPPTVVASWLSATTGIPGTFITVGGYGFSSTPALNQVSFNGVMATPATSSVGFLTVAVPSGSSSGPLTVTSPQGTSNSLTFYVGGSGTVTSIFPDETPGNQDVEIDGSGFGASGSVTMAGATASVVSWSDTLVRVIAPYLGSATGSILVTDPGGGALGYWPSITFLTGTITAWNTLAPATTQLASAHGGGWLGRWGHYLYVGGGYDSSLGYSTSVDRALINTDGSLGTFATLPGVTMTNPGANNEYATSTLAQQASFIGNYAYVFGGSDANGNATDSIQQATVNSDGTMSTFSTVGHLASATDQASVIRSGSYVYVLGGYNGTALNFIQRATINSDSTLGAFSVVGSLPYVSVGAAVAETQGGYVLLGSAEPTGNYTNQGQLAATVAANGTLGSFSQSNNDWWSDYIPAGMVQIGDNLFMFGAANGWSPGTGVRTYPLLAGTQQPWGSATALATPITHQQENAIAIGSRVYIIGGNSGSGQYNVIDAGTVL